MLAIEEILRWRSLRGGDAVDIDAADKYGRTSLMMASVGQHLKAMRLLLQAVVDGRVLTLPSALEPLRECFEDIASH